MDSNQQLTTSPGWVGGFAQSNPAFAYPNPDLSSLPLLDNLANIGLLQRQQGIEWPEFSWEAEKGNANTRCFQMFAPYISRIGYTNTGRVYSIICPQQGLFVHKIGSLNVEVTVTGQRGWVDENTREFAADMTVEGKIWFSPDAHQNWFVKMLWDLFSSNDLPFPSHKSHAIIVELHNSTNTGTNILPVRNGVSPNFQNPGFALHAEEAWTVGNVEVEIGSIKKIGNPLVDEFNQLVMDAFNLASGNMLEPANILTWNVWFTEPGLVDKKEWRTHAERWRKSIDEGHGSPDGAGTSPRYFNGKTFEPIEDLIEAKIQEIIKWLIDHLNSKGRRMEDIHL